MKNYETMTTEDVVSYINQELAKGRSCKDIEINDFGVNERTIRKRLARKGIKINTKAKKGAVSYKPKKENKDVTQVVPQGKLPVFNDKDLRKLKYYLDKFEVIKGIVEDKIIYTSNEERIKINSKETTTTSLRINKELYELVKERSKRDDIKIGNIINRALLDYLNNYL